MKHALLLSTGLVLSTGSFAQNAHLVRLDTTELNTMQTGAGVPTADGGSAVQVREGANFSLWKCDGYGNAQWQNHYPTAITNADATIATTGNGDVLLGYAGGTQSTWGDTTVPSLELWRIAQDGSVIWRKYMTLDTVFGYMPYFYQRINMVENAQSEIFIMSSSDLNWAGLLSVTKVNASGDVLWGIRIGDPAGSMNFPFSMSSGLVYLAPDGTGGCRVVSAAADNDESVNVIRISSDGALTWGKLFDYLGNAQSFTMAAPAVAENGNTLFFTNTNNMDPNGGTHLVRISESGDLLSVEQYQGSIYCADLINDQGTLMRIENQRVISMNETGDLLTGTGFASLPANEDSTYHFLFNHLALKNGRACFSGSFTATPIGVGLPLVSLAVSSFDVDGANCGLVHWEQEGIHTALPLSIFTCDAMASIAAEPTSPTVMDGSLTPEPRPLLASTNLCSFTSIAPVAETPATFSVNRTLLQAGDPLTVTSDRPLLCSIVDVKGAVVWNDARANQRLEIPTAELTPGLYTLMGREVTGQVVGTAKVVVER